MTLLELKQKVDLALQRMGGEDLEVCIPNNKNAMGGTPVTKVRGASCGIDWDRGKFMIYPEIKMIEQNEN